MIKLRDLLTRMQSQATGCVAVLRIDLRDGTVMECCGDATTTSAGAVARVMRDLAAQQHVIPPDAGRPQEVILLSDDRAYVCGRLADPAHHAIAAICRSTQNLGLIISVLHSSMLPSEVETGA